MRQGAGVLPWADRADARLLAAYLGFAAKVVGQPSKTATELKQEPTYQEIVTAPPSVTAKNIQWDNAKVVQYLASVNLPSEKRDLLKAAEERTWRDTTKKLP